MLQCPVFSQKLRSFAKLSSIHGLFFLTTLHEMNKRILFFIIVFFWGHNLWASKPKRALKQLAESQFEKAHQLLYKSLHKKQQITAAHTVLAWAFIMPDNPAYNLDSALWHVTTAQHQYKLLTQKHLRKLQRLEINDSTLSHTKTKIDSLGFEVAQKANTETSYQTFLDKFPTAQQRPLAIEKRNAIAFTIAQKQNTYESYKHFLDKYPHARQAKNAKEIYDILLYETKTKSGQLSDLEHFVKTYPQNPYRERAEQTIYFIYTATHTLEAYALFARQYQRSAYTSKALQWQAALQEDTPDWLFPFIENNKFGFINDEGRITLNAQFDSIPEAYLCEGAESNLLSIFRGRAAGVVGLDNRLACPLRFELAEPLATGLVRVQEKGKFGLWQKANYELISPIFDKIDTLNSRLILVTIGKLKGLYSMQGHQLLPPLYEHIRWEGGLIILEKNQKTDFITENQLFATLQKRPLSLSFELDDLSESHPNFLIGQANGRFGLLKSNGTWELNTDNLDVTETPEGWIVRNDSGFYALNSKAQRITSTYTQIQHNPFYFLVKNSENKWAVLWTNGQCYSEFDLDTVAFLSPKILWAKRAGKAIVSFGNGQWLDFSSYGRLEILTNAATNKKPIYLLAAWDNKQKLTLWNRQGRPISKGKYSKVSLLNNAYIALTNSDLWSILDTNGKEFNSQKYQGLSSNADGSLNTLQAGRFGLLIPSKNKNIAPQYEASLVPYTSKGLYYTAVRKQKYGVINAQNKIIVPFDFDEISFWKKNIALVRRGSKWVFWDLGIGKKLAFGEFDAIVTLWQESDNLLIKLRRGDTELLWSSQRDLPFPFVESYIHTIESPDDAHTIFIAVAPQTNETHYKLTYFTQEGRVLREQIVSEAEYDRVVCEGLSVKE